MDTIGLTMLVSTVSIAVAISGIILGWAGRSRTIRQILQQKLAETQYLGQMWNISNGESMTFAWSRERRESGLML